MRDKKKISNKIVQAGKKMRYPGLAHIAFNLNRTDLKDEEFFIWGKVESIVEFMTDQPRRNSVYTKKKAEKGSTFFTSLSGHYWDPRLSERRPSPEFAISIFNQWAKRNPVTLRVWIEETKSKTPKIAAGLDPVTQREPALLLLWLHYFQEEGWKRLKRCPSCKKWFVDETKNRMKVHCSKSCKWQFWNRETRWTAGHKYQKEPRIRRAERTDRPSEFEQKIVRLLYPQSEAGKKRRRELIKRALDRLNKKNHES